MFKCHMTFDEPNSLLGSGLLVWIQPKFCLASFSLPYLVPLIPTLNPLPPPF